jgi:hypothetical protein
LRAVDLAGRREELLQRGADLSIRLLENVGDRGHVPLVCGGLAAIDDGSRDHHDDDDQHDDGCEDDEEPQQRLGKGSSGSRAAVSS